VRTPFPRVRPREAVSTMLWVKRLAIPAVLLLAFAVLAVKSNSGIWDPFEMNRAAVAQQIAGQPKLLVVESGEALAREVQAAGLDLYVDSLERDRLPDAAAKTVAAEGRVLKKAEAMLRSTIYHGILVDAALLVANPLKGVDFLDGLAQDAPGTPAVIAAESREACNAALDLLGRAMVEEGAMALKTTWQLIPEDTDVSSLVDSRAGAYPFAATAPCAVRDAEGLSAALAPVSAQRWLRIQFKGQGQKAEGATATSLVTQSVPPLDHWLTALSYKAFGFSETSSRLPFMVMGLLLLLAVGLAVRRLVDSDTAGLATAVLASIPLFLGQSKNMAGEVSYALFLALAVLAVALMAKDGFRWSRLAGFLAAALLLFLAKGLFGLLVLLLVMVGYIVLARDLRVREIVLPTALLTALFLLLTLLVQWPDEWTFFTHFKFMNRTFTGPLRADLQTFDYFVRQLAFVALPWTFLLPSAMARLLPAGADEQADNSDSRFGLIVFLWFCIPFAVHTALLPGFTQTVFPACGAIAVAIALLWRSHAREGTVNRFHAVAIFGIAAVVLNSLFESPEHILSFLTADPHFGGKGGQAFPTDFDVTAAGKVLLAASLLVMLAYYGRGGTVLREVAAFLRRPVPFWSALWVLAVLLAVRLAAGLGDRYFVALRSPAANKLTPYEQAFYFELFYRPETLMLFAGVLLFALVALLRFTRLGARADSLLSWLSLPGRWVAAAFRFCTASFFALAAAGLLSLAVLVDMLVTFDYPDVGVGAALSAPAAVVILVGAAVGVVAAHAWALVFRRSRTLALTRGTVVALSLTAVTLAFNLLASYLFRLTDFTAPDIWALTLASFGLLVAWWMPRLVKSPVAFHAAAWSLVVAALLLLVLPLSLHWTTVEQVVYPQSTSPFLPDLYLASRLTWALVALVLLVSGNALVPDISRMVRSVAVCGRTLDRLGPWAPGRWPEAVERRGVFVAAVLACSLGFGAYYAASFLPAFSLEVSQKHILELYYAAEQRSDVGDDIFKYQQKTGADGEDRNFYTAPIPGMDGQQDFTRVLVSKEDALLTVRRSPSHPGPSKVLVRGFSETNDANGDGRRDYAADAGIATASEDGKVVDAAKSWTPDQWKGALLFDWRGKEVAITGNDATTLFVAMNPAMDPDRPETMRYIVDAADAADHKASAMERKRNYVILGQETFSSVNFTFRSSSGGRHIPVLEGSNVNFLLAASHLLPGEENHNRFAQATLSRDDMDRLLAWSASPAGTKYDELGVPESLGTFGRLKGGWVNFDDQIRLLGYQMENTNLGRNDKLRIRFFFEASGKINTSWKIFIHIDSTGASNRINGDHWPLNMSSDPEEKNCVGCWRTNHWMEGDIVLDDYQTDVPLGCPSGTQQLHMGFFTPGSDKRLKVKEFEKGKISHDGSDRVRIGTFEVN
jgi:hypothetical protein